MKTFIHIGQQKTATTSIQHFLKNNRRKLIKQGLYVPDSLAGIDNPSHYILNNYALDAHRYSSTKERILKKNLSLFMDLPEILKRDIEAHYKKASVKNCRDVIWSNEGLYLLDSVDEYKRL